MKSKTSVLRVLYAASEQSADMLYLSGVFVPDPFLALVCGRRSVAVVNRLEYGRVRSHSQFDEVLLLDAVERNAAGAFNLATGEIGPVELIRYFGLSGPCPDSWGSQACRPPATMVCMACPPRAKHV